MKPYCSDGANFSNALSRSTVTGTLSSNEPGCLQVVAVTICGPEKVNSPESDGLPSMMPLKLAIRELLRS